MSVDAVEQTLESQVVFKGKFIQVRRHHVSLPNGKKTIREIVEHPGACACVVADESHNVLLVQQYRKAAEKVLVEIPAGKLDKGEKPEDCVKREVEEETGVEISNPVKLCAFYPSPGFTDEVMHIFFAYSQKQGKSSPMEDEVISSKFVPFQEAFNLIKTGKIQDAKSIIGLLLAREHLQS